MSKNYVGQEVVVDGIAGILTVKKLYPDGSALLDGQYLKGFMEIDRIFDASELKSPPRACHYCGCPATGFGFFDEPICSGCR